MTEQSSNFLKECFGNELPYVIENEAQSRDEKVINEIVESVDDILKNAIDNAPMEIKQELTDLRAEKSAIDVMKDADISVVFKVEKHKEEDKEIDITAETQKYKETVSDFKEMNNFEGNVTQKQMQDFFDKTVELKEQTKLMLDNNILGEKAEQSLSESLSNFKYLENEIIKTGYEIDTRTHEEKSADLEKAVYEILSNYCKDSFYNGEYEITPSNYDDYISPSEIINTFNDYLDELEEGGSFEEYFNQVVYEKYFIDNVIEEECDIVQNLISQFKNGEEYNNLVEEYGKDMVNNFITELDDIPICDIAEDIGLSVSINPVDFVGEYHINLVLNDKIDGKEGSGVDIQNLFSEDNLALDRSNEEIGEMLNTPMTYLIQQQGYNVEEVLERFHDETLKQPYEASDFVKSVVDEIDNTPKYTQLTSLVSVSGKDVIDLLDTIANKDENKAIQVSDDVTVGLFDGKYHGTGSTLEIELEKPFVFTADMVDFVQIEGARDNTENIGYTVDSVYGLTGDVWKADVEIKDVDDTLRKEIDSAKEISSETVENVKEELLNFENERFEKNEDEIER